MQKPPIINNMVPPARGDIRDPTIACGQNTTSDHQPPAQGRDVVDIVKKRLVPEPPRPKSCKQWLMLATCLCLCIQALTNPYKIPRK